ncbi:MAG: hypothetical protein QM759_08920 [Terricaulis sp.]
MSRFDWRAHHLFRPRCGSGPLNSACFPLAPFSNRIAKGRFRANGENVQLAPTFAEAEPCHALHGYGWLASWRVLRQSRTDAELVFVHEAREWPWAFEARQSFELTQAGLLHALSIRNLSDTFMPAGLGVHPYFCASAEARYYGLHLGEWRTSADGLPLSLDARAAPQDWWKGAPIASRHVDTIYAGRSSPLRITWVEQALALAITPCEALSFTAVFNPHDADFFCIEPVSHRTDAINAPAGEETGLKWLSPGESFAVSVRYAAATM